MDHFDYRNGRLHCEDVDVEAIAHATGTPTYIYSAATIRDHYTRLSEAFAPLKPLICYSIKSCSNLSILRLLADLGAGMDVVSGGELHRAKLTGVPGSKIVYAGVGKSDSEIREALEYAVDAEQSPGIRLFNIESEAEFENIAQIAASLGTVCDATLRVNPDVDPNTHEYTTTGKKETRSVLSGTGETSIADCVRSICTSDHRSTRRRRTSRRSSARCHSSTGCAPRDMRSTR